jgi:hypothetical protein
MNHQEKFQEKKAQITARAENEMMKLRIHNRELLTFMVKNEIHHYHEAELKGIRVSCEEMELCSKKLENFEKNLRSNEATDIIHISIKAEHDIEVERKKYEERSWTCEDDGLAHPFIYRGKPYYRTFDGAVWKAGAGELGEWVGYWSGIYIAKGEEPSRPNCANPCADI